MKKVSITLNEAIKHLKPRTEEELKKADVKFLKEIKQVVEANNFNELNSFLMEHMEEMDYEDMLAQVLNYVPKDILAKAIFDAIEEYREYLDFDPGIDY